MLSDLVAGRRATTIAEAIDIMTDLDRSLSDADGLKWFNRLYLQGHRGGSRRRYDHDIS